MAVDDLTPRVIKTSAAMDFAHGGSTIPCLTCGISTIGTISMLRNYKTMKKYFYVSWNSFSMTRDNWRKYWISPLSWSCIPIKLYFIKWKSESNLLYLFKTHMFSCKIQCGAVIMWLIFLKTLITNTPQLSMSAKYGMSLVSITWCRHQMETFSA